jgi:hypothetical protein
MQLRHRPQAMVNGTEQMSPTLMNSTPGPTSTTEPSILTNLAHSDIPVCLLHTHI